MAIRTHVCQVAVGESVGGEIPRLNFPVAASQTTLYSGRAFQLDSSGRAAEKIVTPYNPAYIAYRGVECPDVNGAKAILSTATGSLDGNGSGYQMISAIPMRPGLVILTTEYFTTGSYVFMDAITCATASGRFKEAGGDANHETIGYCLEEGAGVNAAWEGTRKLLKIQFTRSGYGL